MAIVGSNIEVYSCLNPLYYSIEREIVKSGDGIDTLKRDYGIFKNLDENLFIDLRKRLLEDVFKLTKSGVEGIAKQLVKDQTIFDGNALNVDKLEYHFSSGNHFTMDYLNEENTMFIYFDSFESDPALYYKETDLKPIYDGLMQKARQEPKRACRIRVFSRSSDLTKETLKQTIDLDIQNFKRELERYDSRTPGFKKIEKVRFISDYDRNMDYLSLNVEKIVKVSDKKNYLELVDYANSKLKELFKSELRIVDDRDGREIGKVGFFVFPTLQKPGFMDSKKSVKDFLHIIDNEDLKQELTRSKRNIEKSDIEFQKYLKQLKEKLLKGEVVKQLDDFLKNFFELEIYPGINGDGIVNVTKDMHEKNFRFKKGSKGYVSFNAIDVELIVKMRQILPTSFVEFSVLTRENIDIGLMTVRLKYGNTENTLEVEKFELYEKKDYNEMVKRQKSKPSKRNRESKLQTWMKSQNLDDLIEKYKKVFLYKNGKSELNGRTGKITRKTRIVKNVLQVEAYNLASININKPFYIIPLIRFDDKDVAEFLKKESPESYVMSNEDLVQIFTNTQDCYKFYLNVSNNHPDKVYDREKYSDKFKELKMKENVKYIVSKLLQRGKVFRPKIVQGEKPFRGIYKIIGYELDEGNRVRIIKKGVDNEGKVGEVPQATGTVVHKGKTVLQVDPLTFVHYEADSDSVLSKFPPRFQTVTLLSDKDSSQQTSAQIEKQIRENQYYASKLYYEKFNSDQNVIRVPLQLYISQNPPKYHKEFECEIRKNKLRQSWQKLTGAVDAYQDKLPVGKYLPNQ